MRSERSVSSFTVSARILRETATQHPRILAPRAQTLERRALRLEP